MLSLALVHVVTETIEGFDGVLAAAAPESKYNGYPLAGTVIMCGYVLMVVTDALVRRSHR